MLELCKPATVFILDWEKSLLDGVEEVIPEGYHTFCCWHLKDNFCTRFNKKAQKYFETLMYATTPEIYQMKLDKRKDKNVEWYDYLKNTAHPKHYSQIFFHLPKGN